MQKMIQPNPDEPCQWCGATEHRERIRCAEGKECPHCGGIHYGRLYCPYSDTQIEKENKMEGTASRQMPLYNCHKQVWALKIAAVEFDWEVAKREGNRETDGSATITPADEGYGPFKVDAEYVHKHLMRTRDPIVGGYYVVYKDGYKSFSPKQAFEEGYTRA
jgi:hypothetical protein